MEVKILPKLVIGIENFFEDFIEQAHHDIAHLWPII